MTEALTQSDSNLINYNKMAEVNINRISYINLAGAETQSIELYLVFMEGRDNLHRILPLQPKKKNFFLSLCLLRCLGKSIPFGQVNILYIYKGEGCSSIRH